MNIKRVIARSLDRLCLMYFDAETKRNKDLIRLVYTELFEVWEHMERGDYGTGCA